jgi:hypothetical protein
MKTDTMCADMACDRGAAERPRYYARQLITSDDLTLEQDYFRNKLRLHNRMLHGWGVVCGAQVCLVPKKNGAGTGNSNGNGNGNGTEKNVPTEFEPWQVYVTPGYILSPCGDEINIDCGRVVDLRKSGTSGVTGEPCVDAVDPWCVEVFDRDGSDVVFVAVRYKQYATRPVRVQPAGCGCDDTRCENSRWRDGYEIKVLDHCPHEPVDEPPIFDDLFEDAVIPACPAPPDEPWVGLARVELDPDGTVTKIENCACRRMALSLASFWWNCQAAHAIEKVEDANDLVPGEERIIKIQANRAIPPGTKVEAPAGVVIKNEDVKVSAKDNRVLEVPVKVERDAKAGSRTLALRFPNEQRAVQRKALQIRAPAEPAAQDTTTTDKADTKKTGKKPTRDTAPLADTQPGK